MASEILHGEKVQISSSLCEANLTGCEGICPGANGHTVSPREPCSPEIYLEYHSG